MKAALFLFIFQRCLWVILWLFQYLLKRNNWPQKNATLDKLISKTFYVGADCQKGMTAIHLIGRLSHPVKLPLISSLDPLCFPPLTYPNPVVFLFLPCYTECSVELGDSAQASGSFDTPRLTETTNHQSPTCHPQPIRDKLSSPIIDIKIPADWTITH